MDAVIRLSEATKRYGDGSRPAVNLVSLEILPGEGRTVTMTDGRIAGDTGGPVRGGPPAPVQ